MCKNISSSTSKAFIVTNGISITQKTRLQKSTINPYITEIFVSEEIGFQKPDRLYFEYVFSHIPGAEKGKMVMAGDLKELLLQIIELKNLIISKKGALMFYEFKLSKEIERALHALGYDEPTEVQEKVIPLVLEKKDILVKAQTGSGKTAAYAIPICELIQWLENKPQALVLTPTRELAVQVQEDFTHIGRLKRIKATAVYGGHPFSAEKAELKQKTHVVVGTPGRIIDHIARQTLKLDKIEYLVIDEADRMFDMGFMEQVEEIIKELPSDRVTMLFSATISEDLKRISSGFKTEPVNINVSEDGITTVNINHFFSVTKEEEKFEMLTDVTIMENPDSCIIFCSTRDRVEQIWDQLKRDGYSCSKIHGKMEQEDRLSAIRRFKRGEYRYLVSTDVAARGIDIDGISLVINYDVPMTGETYVHRTGRTGRAGKKGKAITFVTPTQVRYIKDVETLIELQVQEFERPDKKEVAACQSLFEEKMNGTPQKKEMKEDRLNKEIMKLRFNGGKKKKLRTTSFVGALSNIEGMSAEDIGIISIQDSLTYVEILNGKGNLVLKAMENTLISGKQLKVTKAVEKR